MSNIPARLAPAEARGTDTSAAFVVLDQGLPSALREDLERVLGELGVALRPWTRDREGDARVDSMLRPSERNARAIIVAALACGSRTVPDDVLALARAADSEARVVLVTTEALIRPALSFHGGMLTIVGPPYSRARFAHRLRMLLDPGHDVRVDSGRLGSVRRVAQGPRFAAIALSKPEKDATDAPLQSLLGADRGTGLTAIVRWEPSEGDDDAALSAAAGAFLAQDVRGVRTAIGPRAGAIHLSDEGDIWTVYWPDQDRPLWLMSPLRLPNAFNLASSLRGGLMRLPTGGNDMMVALASALPAARGGAALYGATLDGIAGAVDYVEDSSEGALAGVFIEVP